MEAQDPDAGQGDATSAANEPPARHPALIVGLGGSGVHTLRVIKGWADSGCSPPLTRALGDGHIRLLGIDTDPASNAEQPETSTFTSEPPPCLPEGLKPLSRLPPLDDDDFLAIDAATQPRAFRDAVEAAQARRRLRRSTPEDEREDGTLADWFPLPEGQGSPPFGPACESGTGHWRPVGRLALYSAAGSVLARLRARADRFPADAPPARAYVVAALGGGTGGGMFWDVALMLRALGHPERVFGAFLLPDPDGALDTSGRSLANGYAALRECLTFNHWRDPVPGTVAWPDGTALVRTRESGPVFDDIFLYRYPSPPKPVADSRRARERLGALWVAQNLLAQLRPDLRAALDNEGGQADREHPDHLYLRPFATSAVSCYPLAEEARLVLAGRNLVERLQRDAALPAEARELGRRGLLDQLLWKQPDGDEKEVVKAIAAAAAETLREYMAVFRNNQALVLKQMERKVQKQEHLKTLFDAALNDSLLPKGEAIGTLEMNANSWLRLAVREEVMAHKNGRLDLADFLPEWAELSSALFNLNQTIQLLDEEVEKELRAFLERAEKAADGGARPIVLEMSVPQEIRNLVSTIGLVEVRSPWWHWFLKPILFQRIPGYSFLLKGAIEKMAEGMGEIGPDVLTTRVEQWLEGPSPVARYLCNRIGDLVENSRYRREQLAAELRATQEERVEPDVETDPKLERLLAESRRRLRDPRLFAEVERRLSEEWALMASETGLEGGSLRWTEVLKGVCADPVPDIGAAERLRRLLAGFYPRQGEQRQRAVACLAYCLLEVLQEKGDERATPYSLAGAPARWHGAVFAALPEGNAGARRRLVTAEPPASRDGPCGSREQRVRNRFAAEVEQQLGLVPQFIATRSGPAVTYYQARCLSARRLDGIECYRRAYHRIAGDVRRFHQVVPERLLRDAPEPAATPTSAVYCGNPDCSFDISSLPRTERFCPGCGQSILNRCGNSECGADDLSERFGSGDPPPQCPACREPMRSQYWYCPDPDHQDTAIPISEDHCPRCRDEVAQGVREVVHHRPGAVETVCPGCVTLALPEAQRTVIPPALEPAFWNGVAPQALRSFEVARKRIDFPPLRCPQGSQRHQLFPVCPDGEHQGAIRYLERDAEGRFRCPDHPMRRFFRCFHCDYPVEVPSDPDHMATCPRCLRELRRCAYCSDASGLLMDPFSKGEHAHCPRCGNRMRPADPLHAQMLDEAFEHPGACTNLWGCAAAADPWRTVSDRDRTAHCRACAGDHRLIDRRRLREDIDRCPLCLSLLGLPDGTGIRRLPMDTLVEHFRGQDPSRLQPHESCLLCGTVPAHLLWWLLPAEQRDDADPWQLPMEPAPEHGAEWLWRLARLMVEHPDDAALAEAVRNGGLLREQCHQLNA